MVDILLLLDSSTFCLLLPPFILFSIVWVFIYKNLEYPLSSGLNKGFKLVSSRAHARNVHTFLEAQSMLQ